ncbi:hypothetical protein [Streptomyces asiaticus]|uniref:hypothetical protein n=1 Tax=Streptomyces asiaticus TaxID=114695 RepID=UPI0038027E16
MGDGEDRNTAAARLRLLRDEFTTPVVRRDLSPPSRSPHGPPPAPANLDILDYMAACRDEVIEHTRTTAPAAGPAPTEPAAVYEWMHQHTAHLAPEQRMVRDAMVLRQGLEHALAMGDEDAIRWEACPRCACWGLFWREEEKRVFCANSKCEDRRGQPSMWTLAQLAERSVAARNTRSRTAT